MSNVSLSKQQGNRFGWPNDANLMRAIFFGLLIGTFGVLYLDFQALNQNQGNTPDLEELPILPAIARPDFDPNAPQFQPTERVTTDQSVLSAPITAALEADGILRLTGQINPGAAEQIIEELTHTSEYIESIVLNSPGGSVTDALMIGNKIRELKLNTQVEDGGYCASSCPLVFAAGVKRIVGQKAVVGVHQIYGVTAKTTAAQAMSDAQTTTGVISTYLSEMGSDESLWLHALETPPQSLYYFTSEELKEFRLATKIN